MRVVLEYDNGEIWGQHEIRGSAAHYLLECLPTPHHGYGEAVDSAHSLIDDLRAGSLSEVYNTEQEPRTANIEFTERELSTLSAALESYWFDCSQGGDEVLAAKRPAIESLQAKINKVRESMF